MDNIIGAVCSIILLLVGIALFPIALAFNGTSMEVLEGPLFILGVLVLSAALPLPIAILDRLER